MRQETGFAVVERNTGFVAGRFNTKNKHGADFNTWSEVVFSLILFGYPQILRNNFCAHCLSLDLAGA